MAELMDLLYTIGILILFLVTSTLLIVALWRKEWLISGDGLKFLKENWKKVRIAAFLGVIALFIFMITEMLELFEAVLDIEAVHLYNIERFQKVSEIAMVYLLICSVAINLYLISKIRGGEVGVL